MALANTAPLHTPLGLLAELTHRCPLGCPYCSNPLALDAREGELDTATWVRVIHEAAALGVLQVHLSGGEPAARRDLVEITAGARAAGLYTNLITSAVGVTNKTAGRARRRRPRSCADFDPGQRAIVSRPHRRLRGRIRKEARAGGRGGAAQAAAHGQRGDAPRQHRADRRDGRSRARIGSEPGRDRACAVLRVGDRRIAPC